MIQSSESFINLTKSLKYLGENSKQEKMNCYILGGGTIYCLDSETETSSLTFEAAASHLKCGFVLQSVYLA